jgi:hypothetical protein
MPGAWLLANVGAEEGASPRGGSVARIVGEVGRLWAQLFGSQSRLLPEGEQVPWPAALGRRPDHPAFAWLEDEGGGVAWLATEAAERELARHGLTLTGPRPAVVRAVHDKAFAVRQAASLGLEPVCLRGLAAVLDPADLEPGRAANEIAGRVASWPRWTYGRFVLKPRVGSSGRGGVHGIWPSSEVPLPATVALERLRRRGGAILEPWLERGEDFSVQLHVRGDRQVEVLGVTRLLVTAEGRYHGNRVVLAGAGGVSSGGEHDLALRDQARLLGEQAAGAGFAGACGVDAFSFRGPGGGSELRPVVELNARYTMGTIALGLLQRARQAQRLGGAAAAAFLARPPRHLREHPALASALGVRVLAVAPAPDPAILVIAPDAGTLDRALGLPP